MLTSFFENLVRDPEDGIIDEMLDNEEIEPSEDEEIEITDEDIENANSQETDYDIYAEEDDDDAAPELEKDYFENLLDDVECEDCDEDDDEDEELMDNVIDDIENVVHDGFFESQVEKLNRELYYSL